MPVASTLLLIQFPGRPEEEAVLEPGRRYSLGRALGNDLPLADPSVSRHHLELRWDGGRWHAKDLGSRNGSFLNGRRLEGERALHGGDHLRLGDVELQLRAPGAPPATPPGLQLSGDEDLGGHTIHSLDARDFLSSGTPSSPGPAARPGLFARLDKAAHGLLTACEPAELEARIVQLVGEAVSPDRACLLLPRGDAGETVPSLEALTLTAQYRAPGVPERPPRISRSILGKVLGEGQALVVGDAQRDLRFAGQESVVLEKIHSALCAPLWDDERITGLLYADRLSPLEPLGQEELELLTLLAHLAAVRLRESAAQAALEEQRRLEEELERAAQIQQQLLPDAPLILGRLQVLGHNRPSLAVGGDYYDTFACADGRALIALGDVAGKGMSAALLMAQVQAMVRALSDATLPLPDMVARLNAAMHRSTRGRRFVTLFIARLDPETGALEYVNAGHNHPLLLRAGGQQIEELDKGGLMLGAFPTLTFEGGRVELAAGDTLLVYSDGLSEAGATHGDVMFGDERVAELLKESAPLEPRALLDRMVETVLDFCAPEPPDDDLTVLVLRLD